MKYGIYVHIPFCRVKCDYCNFYSVPLKEYSPAEQTELLRLYIFRLKAEIGERLSALSQDSADTIYIGGGTPSVLDPSRVAEILDALASIIRIEAGAEITLEMNPEDMRAERLLRYIEAGVNRVVLGVQTLSEEQHRFIGRSSGLCTTGTLDEFFRTGKIIHCVDLIGGIPISVNQAAQDLELIAAYRPEHISAYILSIEGGTRLAQRVKNDSCVEALQRESLQQTILKLEALGYEHYEISNYCLPGFSSRHNLKYWRFDPYIGFGPGAHSFFDGERYMNEMQIDEYLLSTDVSLTRDDRTPGAALVEYILTGLRLKKGIRLQELETRLGAPLPGQVWAKVLEAESNGLMAVDRDCGSIRLAGEGVFLADHVIYGIVESLL